MNIEIRFKLEEVATRCQIEPDIILRFVSHTWVHPIDSDNDLFDEEDIARIQLIYDLKETLGVNDESIPVILHLIDQLNHLHLK